MLKNSLDIAVAWVATCLFDICLSWLRKRILPGRYTVSAIPPATQHFCQFKILSSPRGTAPVLSVSLQTASSPTRMSFRAGSDSLSLWQEGRGSELAWKSMLTDVQMYMKICTEMALFQGVIITFKALILLFICWVLSCQFYLSGALK